jgi:hypothetical protein
MPPTFSKPVSRSTLLRALSSRPKQQKSLTSPLRFLGASPSSSRASYVEALEEEVVEAGDKGTVALMKMRDEGECKGTAVADEERVDVAELGDGAVVGRLKFGAVLRDGSLGRVARGEAGRPTRVFVKDGILDRGFGCIVEGWVVWKIG